jgi:hypothetical protein
MQPTLTVDGSETMNLDDVLRSGQVEISKVAAHLDALDEPTRIGAVRSLSGKAQANLFEAAKGQRSIKLADMVPAEVPVLAEVPHYGLNSLPMFRTFAKVFCRPSAEAKELCGYNRAGGFVETVVGPGYYVAYEVEDGEFLVDYTRLPDTKPEHWPAMLSNQARLSRFVYGGMKDVLRGVSKHVTIGRAIRNGKVVDNWFVLCRALT